MEALKLHEAMANKGLSHREREVAILVSKGLANKEVADQLFVTEKTVKFHLTNLYKKLAIKSRAQLIVWSMPYVQFEELPIPTVQIQKDPVEAPEGLLPTSKIGLS